MRRYVPKGLVAYVFRHPSTAWPLLAAAWPLRRTQWWRRSPFLPVPDPDYWAFRMQTVAGTSGEIAPRLIVEAAIWSRRQRSGR